MIPQLVTVRWRRASGRWLRLYVPVVPALLLLSPVLLIAVLGGLVACLIFGISPLGALGGTGRLVWALPGARFEIDDGQTAVLVSVR
jgi:hypothetical protein